MAKSIVSDSPHAVAAVQAPVVSGEMHATRGNAQRESVAKVGSYPLDFAKIAAHNQTALSTW